MLDEFFLGVDGGGSGCRAILTNQRGTILSFQTGPACNYQNSSPREVEDVIAQLLKQVVLSTSAKGLTVTAAVFGLAGLDGNEDAKILQQVVAQALADNHISARELHVENDGVITLRALIGQGPGIMLLSGTGSIAWGITPGQKPIRSGGWGHLLGDEGSGYAIGKSAVTSILRGYDGRGPITGMESEVLETLECDSVEEIAERAYSDRLSVSGMARLAPLVFRMADEGNEVAQDIVGVAATDLADLVAAVARRLHLSSAFTVTLRGGVLENQPILREQVAQRIASRYPKSQIVNEDFPSALGSTACALRSYKADVAQSLLKLQSDYQSLIRTKSDPTGSWAIEGSALT